MHIRAVLLIFAGMFLFSGCQAWKTTKKVYRGYVLPAEVDVHAKADVEDTVQRMAHVLAPVDEHVEALIRGLQQTEEPSKPQLDALLSEFPWLNGAAAYTPSVRLLAKVPSQAVKPVKATDVLDGLDDAGGSSLHLAVVASELGPEVCLLRNITEGGELQAYIMAHFDPRSLVHDSPDPASILIMHRGTVLWSGLDQGLKADVQDLDWEHMLQDDVQGSFSCQGQRFGWLARYIGPQPLLYVVRMPGQAPA